MKRSESKYKETIGKLRKQQVVQYFRHIMLFNVFAPVKSVPNIYQELESSPHEDVSLLSLRAKSAGARVSGYHKKSKHLANRGAFVGGGFSLCTSVAKLG